MTAHSTALPWRRARVLLAGTARVLPEEEWPRAEAALAAAYGTGRTIYQRALGDAEGVGTYIEISPIASA